MKTILLISPKDPDNPKQYKWLMGGENTFTKLLLRYPPRGVRFIHYEDALREKYISYHWVQYLFVWLQKLRLLPLGPRVQIIKLHRHFDGIYSHAYPVKIMHSSVPLLISESSSNIIFLRDYLQLPEWRVRIWQSVKKVFFAIFDIFDLEVHAEKVTVSFVFSRWAKRIKNREFKIHHVRVVYPGLPIPKLIQKKQKRIVKILFVGVWFERKGGKIVLEAFRTLTKKYPHIQLTIIGELPKKITIAENEPIRQITFMPYRQLVTLYKTHDILVHVPPKIEGYGMTVPEAMSYGMCPVVSNICVLPEFVKHKVNGLVITPNSEAALEDALSTLIKNPRLIRIYGKHSRELFKEKFSLAVFQKQFLQTLGLLFPRG